MRNYRLFIGKEDRNRKSGRLFVSKKKEGNVRVAMFSDFFSDVSDDMFCTNSMYADFKDSIISSIDVYSTKDEITLDIYESKESDEEKRDLLRIGFNKYINACYQKIRQESMNELMQVSVFAVVGILLIILAFGLKPIVPEWVMYCISNFGTVLIWQFVGYWAFEYSGQKRAWDRLKQIEAISYQFQKWE